MGDTSSPANAFANLGELSFSTAEDRPITVSVSQNTGEALARFLLLVDEQHSYRLAMFRGRTKSIQTSSDFATSLRLTNL